MHPLSRLLTAICVGVLLFGVSAPPARAQSIVDRIKKAAEDAKKKAEGNPPATTPSGTTPAQPNGKGPATPATPAKKADAAAPAAAGNVPKSSAKVEEQPLVTADGNQLRFTVSPKGAHAAAVVLRGSRQVVMRDGVDGPKFDDIIGGPGGLAFSPDGTRLAYAARQGTEVVYIVDDKELLRLPTATHPHLAATPTGHVLPQFTANGRHVYFWLYTQPNPTITNGFDQFVYDGVPGPQADGEVAIAFDAGGDHHAYVYSPKRDTFALAVDGKVAPYVAGEPQFTADGLHLITTRAVPSPQGGVTDVLLDGKQIMRAPSASIYVTPVGSGFASVVRQGNPGSGTQFVTIGTQRVAGTDCPWKPGYRKVVFSADAKHWAALCEADSAIKWVVVDGKKGTEYQSIAGLGFTTDGRFVYTASMRNQYFVVTGDQESNGYQLLQPVTPDTAGVGQENDVFVNSSRFAQVMGNRVGFIGVGQNGTNTVVVDGKPLQRPAASNLEFSPDGSRYGFTVGVGNSKTVNIDGTDAQGPTVTFQRPALANQTRTPRDFLFSPDGKHVVYFTIQSNGQSGIVFDGKFTPLKVGYPMNPTFTPDGRHLIWMDRPGGSAQVVYVDGRPAADMDFSSTNTIPGTWEMAADGTLTVVGQSGDTLKRYRITPPADTSIDNLAK